MELLIRRVQDAMPGIVENLFLRKDLMLVTMAAGFTVWVIAWIWISFI
jgi:hypothetical protein